MVGSAQRDRQRWSRCVTPRSRGTESKNTDWRRGGAGLLRILHQQDVRIGGQAAIAVRVVAGVLEGRGLFLRARGARGSGGIIYLEVAEDAAPRTVEYGEQRLGGDPGGGDDLLDRRQGGQ